MFKFESRKLQVRKLTKKLILQEKLKKEIEKANFLYPNGCKKLNPDQDENPDLIYKVLKVKNNYLRSDLDYLLLETPNGFHFFGVRFNYISI